MRSEAVEAGLDVCDVRLLYSEFKTSTPPRGRVCRDNNADCWGSGYNNASNIDPPVAASNSDSDNYVSVWIPDDTEREEAHESDADSSYGGAWAPAPTSPAQLADSSSPPPSGMRSYGISVFDSTLFQWPQVKTPQSERVKSTRKAVMKGKKVKFAPSSEQPIIDQSLLPELEQSLNETTCKALDTGMYHAKSNAELKAEKATKGNLCDFRTETLKILVNNIRGFHSKRESVAAIMAREEIDIACFCETLFTGSRFPEITGYNTFFRNRKEKGGGGVAVLIKQELATYAVKIDSGDGDNEYVAVKFTNCNPHLVVIIYYGCQAKIGIDNVKLHISQLLNMAGKLAKEGCNIQLVGDFNLRVGNSVIKANDSETTVAGRIFTDQLEIHGLHMMNILSPNPITYIDRSGKDHRRAVLDLVISNKPETISEFKTDDEKYEFTPYSVHMRRGSSYRTHADHMSITYKVTVQWQDRVEFNKEAIWNYKKQLGNLKFHLFTSNACNFLINKVESEPDINKVHKAFVGVLKKGKISELWQADSDSQ